MRSDIKSGPFSKAEDDLLLEAVKAYAQRHRLPQDDLSWASSELPKAKKAANQKYKYSALAEVRTTCVKEPPSPVSWLLLLQWSLLCTAKGFSLLTQAFTIAGNCGGDVLNACRVHDLLTSCGTHGAKHAWP